MLYGLLSIALLVLQYVDIYSTQRKEKIHSCSNPVVEEIFAIIDKSNESNVQEEVASIVRLMRIYDGKYFLNMLVRCDEDSYTYNESIFEHAIRHKKNKFIKPLVQLGADVNYRHYRYDTVIHQWVPEAMPLHYAIYYRNFAAALEIIRKYCAKTYTEDGDQRTALDILCSTPHAKDSVASELLDLLLSDRYARSAHEQNWSSQLLNAAAVSLNYHMIPKLIAHRACPDIDCSTLRKFYSELKPRKHIVPTLARLLRIGANPYLVESEGSEIRTSFFKEISYDARTHNLDCYALCKDVYHTWRSNLKVRHRIFERNACAGTLQWNQSESKRAEEWVDLPFLPIKIINKILDYAVPWSADICKELRKKQKIKRLIQNDIQGKSVDNIRFSLSSMPLELPSIDVIGCDTIEQWIDKHIMRSLKKA